MKTDTPPPAFRDGSYPLKDVKDLKDSKDSKDAPPGYDEEARPAPPDLSATFANLNLDRKERKPTPDQCVAHLKLLEAISQLREDVGSSNGLYGLFDTLAASQPEGRDRDQLLGRIREKRWAIYVQLAARRFETWFSTVEPGTPMITLSAMDSSSYKEIEKSKRALVFTRDNMPPLGKSNS